MTRALSFTQASLRRALKAAEKEGFRVTAIRPDGTLMVERGDNGSSAVAALAPGAEATPSSKWEDVEA